METDVSVVALSHAVAGSAEHDALKPLYGEPCSSLQADPPDATTDDKNRFLAVSGSANVTLPDSVHVPREVPDVAPVSEPSEATVMEADATADVPATLAWDTASAFASSRGLAGSVRNQLARRAHPIGFGACLLRRSCTSSACAPAAD